MKNNSFALVISVVLLLPIYGCTAHPRYLSNSRPDTTATLQPRTPPANRNGSYTFHEEGYASFYADKFHGRQTANGEIFDMHKLTAAHKDLPFNTVVRVTNLNNNRSIVVRINDRGPFVENRVIDLSYRAAQQIGMIEEGIVPVKIEIKNE
ncbi:Rare lipoprotein A [Chitinispirillum alkaliphilum]|nr:Rare lipoprotein A [Chitinispirillum alkaliphilum]